MTFAYYTLGLFLYLLSSLEGHAVTVEAYPLHSMSLSQTMSDEFDDLAMLGAAIGDKRIVFLDELTHGEGNVFALKSRIVSYLHQKKGFEVLVLESGLFDVAQLWASDKAIPTQAAGNIFYMYARSTELQPLWQYINKHRHSKTPLILAGFDNRHSGEISLRDLVPAMRQFLATLPAVVSNEQYLHQLQQLLQGQLSTLPAHQQKQFLHTSQALEQHLVAALHRASHDVETLGFWLRVNASLRQMALVAWQQLRFDQHDLAMAANLDWLVNQQYAGRKIIVWGHYIHLNRHGGFIDALYRPEQGVTARVVADNMTSALPAKVRAESYILHFSGAQGRYLDFRDLQQVAVHSDETMLERRLTAQFATPVFVPLSQSFEPTGRLWGHEYKSTLTWAQAQQRFDGMILLPQITPTQLSEVAH